MKSAFSFLLAVIIAAAVVLVSCTDSKTVTIAEQYGLAYAPLQIMRSEGFLEKLEPEITIEWVKLGNTAAIREAVLAGKVDLGFMGLPPFLIGADKGMDWKLISGLSICPIGLAAGDSIPDFDSLTPAHRIALPQPGSIQHILLSMAAERTYGDASRFDSGLVTMKHPDGMTALFSGAVDAHFTSPPYIFMEEAAGFKTILSGFDAFGGEFSFIGAMAAGSFIEKQPEVLNSFLTALQQSIDFINYRPADSAIILADLYELPEADIRDYLTHEGMTYTTELYGLETFISFMSANGYLKSGLSAADVVYASASASAAASAAYGGASADAGADE